MKAIKRNLNKTSKYGLTIFAVVCILIFLLNRIIVAKVKNAVVGAIEDFNNNYMSLDYENIKVSCFPYSIKIKLFNSKFTLNNRDRKFEIYAKEITANGTLFTKNFNVVLPNKMELTSGQGDLNEATLENHYLNFKLGKNHTLTNFDFFVQNLTTENIENSDIVVVAKNMSVKIIGIVSNEYKNRTFRFNVDSLTKKNLRKNIEAESNFELVISNLRELDSDNNIVAISNLIDTISFNDITNNYAFKLNGNYSADKSSKNLMVDLNMEVDNYNSLISAINSRNDDYFLDKSRVYNFIQLLELVPANKKDTKNNRYYKIVGDLNNRAIFINDEDINNIFKQIFYKGGI